VRLGPGEHLVLDVPVVRASLAPHFARNLAVAGFSFWQAGHNMSSLPGLATAFAPSQSRAARGEWSHP
jgi:hypothetical protein